jgi:hypothetical protein
LAEHRFAIPEYNLMPVVGSTLGLDMARRTLTDTAEPPPQPTDREFALYSRDMLRSLQRIAARHNLALFGHLLDLAGAEAARIAEEEDKP